MRVQTLTLQHFRNYQDLSLELEDGLNILVGHNGQGKTNIVEAIALTAYLKSFRVSSLNHLIHFDEGFYRIVEEAVDKAGIKNTITHFFGKHNGKLKKEFRLNDVPKRPQDLFGVVRVVLFSPEQLNLLLLGPEYRRRHLNFLVLQLRPSLWNTLLRYAEILRHRSALLYQVATGRAAPDELEYWDDQLIEHGTAILEARKSATDALNETLQDHFAKIAFEKSETCQLRYEDGLGLWRTEGVITREAFKEALLRARPRELEKKSTLVGPHRDNFSFLLNGKDVSRYGSRGELRTAVLALKFAERDALEKEEKPILLLDDVMSELDSSRRRVILNLTKGYQTVITSSEKHPASEKKNAALFAVENSKVTRL